MLKGTQGVNLLDWARVIRLLTISKTPQEGGKTMMPVIENGKEFSDEDTSEEMGG